MKRLSLFLTLFLCLGSLVSAQTKSQLRSENAALQAKIDSLVREMEGLRAELEAVPVPEIPEETPPAGVLNLEDLSKEQVDSIYYSWYMLGWDETLEEVENVDSVVFESDVPDSVYLQRLKDLNCYIPIAYNNVVRNYIILYSQKRSKTIAGVIEKCEFYFPLFKETFNKYGVPEECIVLSVVESRLNPQARSRVGAQGIWQFMHRTATGYGLTINSFVDERMDVAKSTDAAARFLKNAYDKFGDWNLAMCSYNCGAGNVRKAISRSGGKTDFWDIYPYLPRETRSYVPAFVGALYALSYYKEHGITPVRSEELPVHIDTFHVKKMLHFQQIEDVVGVPKEMIARLNPQYLHEIIPGDKGDYILRLPVEYTDEFVAVEDSIYDYKAEEFFNPLTIKKIEDGVTGDGKQLVYKVKQGDTLSGIGARYHVSVSQLQKWNNMGKRTNLSIGQKLIIYQR